MNQGSILLAMVILLSLLAGFAVTFIKAPNRRPQIRHDRLSLIKADQQLRSFMAFNGRLPCPDTNGDGTEDCAAGNIKGRLPYLTLGLKEPGYGAGDVALRYGLYRKADNTEVVHDTPFGPTGSFDFLSPLGTWDPLGWFTYKVTTYAHDADLGVLKNRYEPTAADDIQFNTANENTADFCTALQNGAGAAADTTHTYIQSTAAGTHNAAYVIAAAGYGDSDNSGSLFDGLNGSSAVGFNGPRTPISVNYDDQVISRSFADLKNDMQCDVVVNSLNLMADAVHSQLDVASQSAGMKVATIVGAAMAGTTVLLNSYDFALAVTGAAAATAALTAATAAETAAIAACVVAVGCPEVPIMTAAVAAGVAAEAASDLGVILTATAVGLQITAAAAYTAIAIAANIVLPATAAADLSGPITQTQNSLNTATSDLASATAAASSARATATQAFTTADNTLSAISSYAKGHDDPNAVADPAVIAKTQAVFTAKDAEYTAAKAYRDKAAEWNGLQKKCDALTPPNNTTECADAAAAESAKDTAKDNMDAKSALVATAEQDAKNTANNFLVYDSSNQSCSSVTSCNLPDLVQQAINQYTTAIQDDALAAAKEKREADLQQQVADLQNSLASLTCAQQGKFYDSTTTPPTCTDQPNPTSLSNAAFATGAVNLLKTADSLGTTQ